MNYSANLLTSQEWGKGTSVGGPGSFIDEEIEAQVNQNLLNLSRLSLSL
jgi:hypothetical protein